MSRILVTGGAGYIGSQTCKALAAVGHIPIALDNLVYGHRRAVRWGPLEIGDIVNRSFLDTVIERHRPEAVIHFAAYAYVGESARDPGRYYRNNVTGTLTLLEAMRDHRIPYIIFSSTCATYGNPQKIPIDENHPQQPISPYGASKLMVERMLADFEAAHGLGWVVLRYFNAAGADPDGELGENHDPETHLIPLALQAALLGKPILKVFGNDYSTPDGSCIRDYIHVSDLANAHIKSLDYLLSSNQSDAFNLGTGKGTSVFEVISCIQKVTGYAVPYEIVERRVGDPPILCANAQKANHLLGWTPHYLDLFEIIQHAWRWFESQ